MKDKKVTKPAAKLEPITSKEVLASIAGAGGVNKQNSHVFCRDRINGGEKYDYSF